MEYVMGVDTGGTFTDVVAINGEGHTVTGKAPTTVENLAQGILGGIEDIARQIRVGIDELLGQTKIFKVSGTIATNTLLTRTGVKTGLITTAGFEDTLYIARCVSAWAGLSIEETRHVYRQQKPEPLVPKSLVRGITERTDWQGSEVCTLDTEEVRQAARSLEGEGVRSIAVCFIWSVRNGAHEAEAERIISEECPGVYLSVSHKVAPSLGEYERFTTTVMNAYLGPVVAEFLSGLETTLRERGFKGQALVMQAHGGCVYPHEALPVHTLQSGPSAGVIASKNDGEALGHSNVVTTDVGGTSFDVGLVAAGSWLYAREPIIGRFHVSFPLIEVVSIGAGGGSVAWVDQLGVLHVGPQSAGAYPGPACYGQGGTGATVTDADLVLGYLNPDYFLGGRMKLFPDKAREAVQKLANRIGIGLTLTAAGIFDIANAHMAGLLTSHVVGRGHDPRDFAVFAYGGAGGTHAAFYAAEAGVQEVVVPAAAATYSALGAATADLFHSAQSYDFFPMPTDPDRFNGNFKRLEATVKARLDRDKVAEIDRTTLYFLEMRYGVQVHTVRFRVPRKDYNASDLEEVCATFDQVYETLYGKGSGFSPAGRFVVSCTVEGFGRLPTPSRPKREENVKDPSAALAGTREAYFSSNGGYVPTNVYRYDRLQPGNTLSGPAILEGSQTTVVVPPGFRARVDGQLNLCIGIPRK